SSATALHHYRGLNFCTRTGGPSSGPIFSLDNRPTQYRTDPVPDRPSTGPTRYRTDPVPDRPDAGVIGARRPSARPSFRLSVTGPPAVVPDCPPPVRSDDLPAVIRAVRRLSAGCPPPVRCLSRTLRDALVLCTRPPGPLPHHYGP